MIQTIFIIQIVCFVIALINVLATGANNYSELNLLGKICSVIIIGGMVIQFAIQIIGIFKKRK